MEVTAVEKAEAMAVGRVVVVRVGVARVKAEAVTVRAEVARAAGADRPTGTYCRRHHGRYKPPSAACWCKVRTVQEQLLRAPRKHLRSPRDTARWGTYVGIA